jgi:hypothetical protein
MKHATLPSSAQPGTSRHYTSTTTAVCGVRPSMLGMWCSASSRVTRTATSSLRHGRGHTSLRKCSDQAPISSRPSMAKSSSTCGTLSSYVTSTPSFFQVVNILMENHVSEIKGTFPYQVFSDTLCIRPLLMLRTKSKRLRKQTLSETGRTAKNPRPSGYGTFALQCNQSLFRPRLKLHNLSVEMDWIASTFLYIKKEQMFKRLRQKLKTCSLIASSFN